METRRVTSQAAGATLTADCIITGTPMSNTTRGNEAANVPASFASSCFFVYCSPEVSTVKVRTFAKQQVCHTSVARDHWHNESGEQSSRWSAASEFFAECKKNRRVAEVEGRTVRCLEWRANRPPRTPSASMCLQTGLSGSILPDVAVPVRCDSSWRLTRFL